MTHGARIGGLLMVGQAALCTAVAAPQSGEMAGYLLVGIDRVPETFDGGFSMYVAAWPLLREYPGSRFQTGLFGTWMHARDETKPPDRRYSDIEGGLGWWRDTRFATETPKFIMGGVALNFSEWANGPGAGKGRNWANPTGLYGVAQLSPYVLWPPDGLNLAQGTCGELFGYGYLPLPLTEPKQTTAGRDMPTGNQCWTLFLNTSNFKGPVAFFTPYFWTKTTLDRPELAGVFLDTRPAQPNRAVQMETQYIPAVQAQDGQGTFYARIAPTRFPIGADGQTAAIHRIMSYTKHALWEAVATWFDGGAPASGAIDPAAAVTHQFNGRGGATWRIYTPEVAKEERVKVAWQSFATPTAVNPETFGYHWGELVETRNGAPDHALATLPEYYRLVREQGREAIWVPVRANEVPAETGLAQVTFKRPTGPPNEPYVTPDDPTSCWKRPGPVAGPFRAKLGDGSVVTYSWYRFADQPALLNADLSDAEREALQKRVELLHRHWLPNRDYLPPPATGQLAGIDPALIVTPPAGLEVGYVPIVTRQEAGEQ